MEKILTKFSKLLLALFLAFTSLDLTVFAEDANADDNNDETVAEVTENTSETTVEEVAETTDVTEEVDLSALDELDFSSGRLLVSEEEADLEGAPVIGVLDGLALVQYETEEEAKLAYLELSEQTSVAVDTADFGVADDEELEATSVEEVLTEESNPFTEVEKAEVEEATYDIAVIDTGAKEADGIVSVLGDDGIDYHGHGQNMINTIKGINPSAKVLSIKALDNSGVGGTSAIYAAIRIAIDNKVKIINLSISATKTEDNKIIEDIINEAVEKGIKVVGAAGNNNIDAVNTIPGGVESAIVIGASDDEGNRQEASNFGTTVDYLMPAASTSYAAAKVSAYLSLDADLEEAIANERVEGKVVEEQEANEYFETQPGEAGGGTIGGGNIGGVAGDQQLGVAYQWYDTNATRKDTNRHYNLDNMTNARLDNERKHWTNILTNVIKSSNAVSVSSSLKYADWPSYYGSFNGCGTQWTGEPCVGDIGDEQMWREAFKQALTNALNRRDADQRARGVTARVVAVGVTYQTWGASNSTEWFLGSTVANGVNVLGGSTYKPYQVISGTDGRLDSGINKENGVNQSGNTIKVDWNSSDGSPIAGMSWDDATYQVFKNDTNSATYQSTQRSIHVIAVLDDEPRSNSLSLKVTKLSQNSNPLKRANIVVYNDKNNNGKLDRGTNGGASDPNDELVYQAFTDAKGNVTITFDEDNPKHIGKIVVYEHMAPQGYVRDDTKHVYNITKSMFDDGELEPLVISDFRIDFKKVFTGITAAELTDTQKSQFEFRVFAGDASQVPAEGSAAWNTECTSHGGPSSGCFVDKWTGVDIHTIGTYHRTESNNAGQSWIGSEAMTLWHGKTYTIVESKVPNGFTKMEPIEFKAINSDDFIISNPGTSGKGFDYGGQGKFRRIIGTNSYTVDLKINKRVANAFTEYVKNNPNYDLAGTEFTVYYDEAMRDADIAKDINGNNVVLTVKKNSDGTYSTDTVKVKRNGKTTLYAKETKTGKGYKTPTPVNNKFPIDINGKSSATLTVNNEPLTDPVDLVIRKLANGNDINNVLPLSGAVFELRYYALDVSDGRTYTKADLASKTPAKTVRGTTKLLRAEDVGIPQLVGRYGISFTKLVSNMFGDDTNSLPLGVYVIEEITPAPGYLKSNTKFISGQNKVLVESDNTLIVHSRQQNAQSYTFVINDAGKNEEVSWQDVWEQYEPSEMTQKFDFIKVDKDFKRENEQQGDATFTNATFVLTNKSDHVIFYGKKGETDYEKYIKVDPGQDVETFTMDASGKSNKLPITLSPGEYELQEVDPSTGYLLANKYTFTVQASIDNTNNEVISTQMEEPIKQGGITLKKVDEDRNTTNQEVTKPQGDALLGNGSANAEISIYNISDKAVVNKDGTTVVSGKSAINYASRSGYANKYLVQKIYTNTAGVASTGNKDLPYGTYVAIETTPSRGYLNNDDWYVTFQIREDGKVIDLNDSTQKVNASNNKDSKSGWISANGTKGNTVKQALSEEIYRGGIDVQKINEELDKAQNEGHSSLAGNKFNIVNASLQDVYVEGKWYGKVADKDSNKTNWTVGSVKRALNITRTELINAKNQVSGNGAVVKTLVTDEKGFAQTDLDTLPYGTYYLYEAETNSSMLLDDNFVLRIEIREDGKMVSTTEFKAENEVVRGDVFFTKVNEDGKMRPNTPFLIASLDADGNIIESHVIVTDSSGIASTAFIYDTVEEDNMIETTQRERKHSENTNKMDNYVKKNADGSYSVTEDGEALLASGEASTYGVWFSQGLNPETGKIVKNSKATVDDDKGSLYYGIYQIFEIQCKENKDLGEDLLISEKFPIRNKDQVYNATGDLMSETSRNVGNLQQRYAKTFVDLEVLMASKAKDAYTGTQVALLGEPNEDRYAELTDTISFSNVKSTSTYKFVVSFQDTETGNVLSEVVVDRFKPEKTNKDVNTTNQPNFAFTVSTNGTISKAVDEFGTETLSYQGEPTVTSTGNVNLKGLEGKSVSVVVELYEYITGYDFESEDDYKEFEALNFITVHNVDRTDENQKIYIPKMETTASDTLTGDHVGTRYDEEGNLVSYIADTIKLTNIGTKEKYLVVEYLWDATNNARYTDEEQTYEFYSDRDKVRVIEEYTIEMAPFKVNTEDLKDRTLVVMEELWRIDNKGNKVDDIPVITHKELIEEQSVHYPDIDTELTDEFTEDHVGTVAEKVTLTDKVELKNLIKDMEYVVKADLVYQADCVDANGVSHKAGDKVEVLPESVTEVTITPEETGNHTVYMTYVVDSRVLEGISVVSTEYLYHNNVMIDKHVDLEDKDQTVNFPKLRTVAHDGSTNDNVGTVMADGTLIDTVQLWNLVEGEEYTVVGTLVYQEDGTPVEGVVCEPITFVATAEQVEFTEVEMKFTNIDATKLAGKSVVVYEKLFHPNENTNEPVEVNRHEDLTDKPQTVHYPDVRTEAIDSRTGDKVGSIFGQVTNAIRRLFGQDVLDEDETEIIDKVILTNLVPGMTYEISGVLMDQDTGKLLNGQEIRANAMITVNEDGSIVGANKENTGTTKFDETNNTVDGWVELTFRLGTEEITNKTVVVFEKLFHNDVEINKHEDIDDRSQFVNLIDVDSVAVDANTQSHAGDVPNSDLPDTKIIENFFMKKLVNGQDYEVVFSLVSVEESDAAGKPIYLAADGTTTENKEDAITQVVNLTALAEKETSGWRIEVSKADTIVETFEGATYDEVQALYEAWFAGLSEEDKADTTTKVVINSFTEMVPDEEAFSASANLTVEFNIDSESVAGKTIVVVADVYHNGTLVAIHSDIHDEDQSVHYPAIATTLVAENLKTVYRGHIYEMTDTVEYKNLLVGETYRLEGRLVNDKGEALPVEPTSVEFVAEEKDGSVEMVFTVDSALFEDEHVVAFEKLYLVGVVDTETEPTEENPTPTKNVEVAKHEDLKDPSQTVTIIEPTEPKVEKYINKAVHKDVNLDEVFRYDIVAFVPENADEIELKDVLNGDLQFVSKVEEIVLVDLGVDNNHKVENNISNEKVNDDATVSLDGTKVKAEVKIDGQTLTINAPAEALRGHWVKATFDAKIKDGLSVDDLKFAEIKDNNPVITDESHTGVPNEASLRVRVRNDWSSDHKSNVVTVKPQNPKIGTVLTGDDGKSKTITVGEKVGLIDTVTFENLTVGKDYVLVGWLIDKADPNKALTEKFEVKFTAAEANGSAQVKMQLDTTKLQGKNIVAFEELYIEEVTGKTPSGADITTRKLITDHKDPNDANQTVTVATRGNPNTNVSGPIAVAGIGSVVALLGIAFYAFSRKKRKSMQ